MSTRRAAPAGSVSGVPFSFGLHEMEDQEGLKPSWSRTTGLAAREEPP
jgi:hypothetical protein